MRAMIKNGLKKLADEIVQTHQADTLTLVVVKQWTEQLISIRLCETSCNPLPPSVARKHCWQNPDFKKLICFFCTRVFVHPTAQPKLTACCKWKRAEALWWQPK